MSCPRTCDQLTELFCDSAIVPVENYAASFGHEWNTHDRTQYDETSGFNASSERFRNETRWGDDLAGQVMLEVGSGSGRFTREAF